MQPSVRETKKALGQFFTTNHAHIMRDMGIPPGVRKIVEPFAGNGDMLNFIEDESAYDIERYDIDPKNEDTVRRDTLADPPCYDGAFVITNPPYLARNKTTSRESKALFDRYGTNDLYKCFFVGLLTNRCVGGIVVVPLNFWCSVRKMDVDLRKRFLETYRVERMNVFEERVFDDTSYTVCCFQFGIRGNADETEGPDDGSFEISMYPGAGRRFAVRLDDANNHTFGGEIYALPTNDRYAISRLVRGGTPNTNILVKCIDDNERSRIGMKIVEDADLFYDDTPNRTARTYATLVITPAITRERQEKLVADFDAYLDERRARFHSLFLSNYRESNSIARKRISFDLVYRIVGFLLI